MKRISDEEIERVIKGSHCSGTDCLRIAQAQLEACEKEAQEKVKETIDEWRWKASDLVLLKEKIMQEEHKEKVREILNDEWLEVELAHKLEKIVKQSDENSHYLYYRKHAIGIVNMFKQALKQKYLEHK